MPEKQPELYNKKVGEADLERIEEIHDSIVDWVEDSCAGILEQVLGKEIEYFTAKRELPLKTKRKAIGGFVDLDVMALQHGEWSPIHVCFEIKSRLARTGYLFRQLEWYRDLYDKEVIFLIVSPDVRHQKRIRDNEHHFLRFEDGTLPITSNADRLVREDFNTCCEKVWEQYLELCTENQKMY
jgi:hypothetical protein